MDNETIALTGLAAAPIVTALVAAIGAAVPALPRRAYPLVAVAIGVAWNIAASAAAAQLGWFAPIYGIVAGLAASGLYSGAVKPAVEALRSG
jgi:hypothetical protein